MYVRIEYAVVRDKTAKKNNQNEEGLIVAKIGRREGKVGNRGLKIE